MGLLTLHLAIVRLHHQWPLAAAQGLGLFAAVALAVTVPLVQSIASEAGLRSVVENLGSSGYVTIEQLNVPTPDGYDAFQRDVSDKVLSVTRDQLVPAARYAQGPKQTPFQLNGQPLGFDPGEPLPDLATWERLEQHVNLVSGVMPADGRDADGNYPFTIAADGAHDFTIKTGDVLCFNRRNLSQRFAPATEWCAKLAAVWTARETRDPYWTGTVPAHSFMLGRQAYFALIAFLNSFRTVTSVAAQTWQPSLGHLHATQITAFAGQINQLRGTFAVQRDGLFSTGIDTAIKDFRDRYAVASFTIEIVAVALLLIALYSIAYTAGHFLDAQGPTLAVLRGRGWSRRRVWVLLMLQFGLLAVLAVPAGLAAAQWLSRRLGVAVFGGATPQLDRSDLQALAPLALALAAIALGILGGLAVNASRRGVLAVRRSLSRAQERPWWRWRNLDLVGAALAIPLLGEVQLRGSGSVRAASLAASDDPFSLVFPGLALALLAVAALRLLPLAATAVRVLSRRLPGRLAAWQLDRQPVQHARLAVLVSFAVAVGLFSTIYASTERANTADRAAYEAGADVRVLLAGANRTPPNVDDAISKVPSLAVSSTAFRADGSPGRSNLSATVLAIDPGSFKDVAWTRPDLASVPMDQLEQRLLDRDPDGVSLPGEPGQLSIWVWSSGLGGVLTAEVTDANGRACACRLGALDFTGARVLTTPLAFTSAVRFPLRLRGFSIHSTLTGNQDGELAVGDLRVAGGDALGSVVQAFDSAAGWWQEYQGPVSNVADLVPDLAHPRAGQPTATLPAHLFQGTLTLQPPPTKLPLPALLSADTLRKLGVGLDQPFPMHVDSVVTDVTAVGVVDYFPGFYPGRDQFLVLPRDSLLGRLGHDHYSQPWPNEAWLKLRGDPAAAVKTLRSNQNLVDLEVRETLLANANADPLRLALQTTLTIGFAAALAMAVAGFGLHFLIAARERHSEYAVLQANGMPSRLIQRSLAAEQAVLLVYSVLVGAALALLMAWAILPYVQVSPDLPDLVPPTVIRFDTTAEEAVLALVLVVAFVFGQLASRLGGRLQLLQELRLLG